MFVDGDADLSESLFASEMCLKVQLLSLARRGVCLKKMLITIFDPVVLGCCARGRELRGRGDGRRREGGHASEGRSRR